jgi:biopolymer transport protein ExbD
MRVGYFLLPAAALALLCRPALALQDCETGTAHIVKVNVLPSGEIQWDGDLLNREEVLYRLLDVGNREHQTRIHMVPDRNAPYQSVARFLSDAKNMGVFCVDFTSTEKQG